MNIIQIIPGSGGSFYCGNCLRDSKYVDALKSQGHKVVKIPMYLPLFSDEHDISDIPVFYGAISLYLKQMFPVFRHAPEWFDNLLNSKPMMKMAASMSGSTRATGLEDMTVSMLLGEEGKQQEELDKMVDWIADHCKPDIVHLSNALLLGLARRIKEKLNVQVVCSLQDEDVWVDVMQPQFRDRVWKLMGEKANNVGAFIPVSNYYSGLAQKRMNIPDEKLFMVHLGVDPADYQYKNSVQKKERNIGFISRISPINGLHILVDAFILLKKKPENHDVHLHITGGYTGDDKKYVKELKDKLAANGLMDDSHFWKKFEGEHREHFFERMQVISVPVPHGEAFGIYLTESMACGIPVLQPETGAFPEIIAAGGGGVAYSPNTPEKLSESLSNLINDTQQLEKLSDEARKSVEQHFDINIQAEKLVEVYKKFANKD